MGCGGALAALATTQELIVHWQWPCLCTTAHFKHLARCAACLGPYLPADHEAKQVAALGGAAPDRSSLFIGVGRAEMNRTEFFQVGAGGVVGKLVVGGGG